MGFATHLGPWLLGTVKNTTGTTAGLIRNTGAAVVVQTKKVTLASVATGTTTTLFTIPAGSHILQVLVDTLTTLSGNSITSATAVIGTSGTTNLFFPSTSILTAGRANPTLTTTQVTAYAGAASTASPDGIGVGTSDVIVQMVSTVDATPTAGIVQVTMAYIVANSDGALVPAATQN